MAAAAAKHIDIPESPVSFPVHRASPSAAAAVMGTPSPTAGALATPTGAQSDDRTPPTARPDGSVFLRSSKTPRTPPGSVGTPGAAAALDSSSASVFSGVSPLTAGARTPPEAAPPAEKLKLVPCTRCSRTFFEDRLEVHLRSCKGPRKAAEQPAAQAAAPSQAQVQPRSERRATTAASKTLVACSTCSRTFFPHRLEAHARVCRPQEGLDKSSPAPVRKTKSLLKESNSAPSPRNERRQSLLQQARDQKRLRNTTAASASKEQAEPQQQSAPAQAQAQAQPVSTSRFASSAASRIPGPTSGVTTRSKSGSGSGSGIATPRGGLRRSTSSVAAPSTGLATKEPSRRMSMMAAPQPSPRGAVPPRNPLRRSNSMVEQAPPSPRDDPLALSDLSSSLTSSKPASGVRSSRGSSRRKSDFSTLASVQRAWLEEQSGKDQGPALQSVAEEDEETDAGAPAAGSEQWLRSIVESREIVVYLESYGDDSILGEVIVDPKTTVKGMREMIVEELGQEPSFKMLKKKIPIHLAQNHKAAFHFFRSDSDYCVISY